MRLKYLLIAPMLMAFTACGGSGKAKLSGTIKNANGQNLVFEKIQGNQPVPVDTVLLDAEGKFAFNLPQGKLEFYRLNLGNNNFIVLCLDSTNNAVIEGDGKSLNESYTIKGSKNSEIIHDYFKEINPLTKKRYEIENKLSGINFADTTAIFGMRKEIEDIMKKVTEVTHSFIDKNPESPSLVVMQSFLNPEVELPYFKKIEAAIAKSMPGSPYHNQVSTYISQVEYQLQQIEMQKKMQENLAPGKPVSDIKLPGLDGKEMALSSLKGKVVLIDFWASWCGPCRKENPNVVRLYKEYNKKGFEVFSVSLDDNKDAWKRAVEADGLVWPYHVSDLAKWNSVVVKQFGITGIPFTILVGKDGNIIATGLRGPQLEQKLKELIK